MVIGAVGVCTKRRREGKQENEGKVEQKTV